MEQYPDKCHLAQQVADTPFWRLYAIATGEGEVCAKAREIFGSDRLALALATLATKGTTLKIKPSDAADALGIAKQTAFNRINEIGVKRTVSDNQGQN